MIRVFHLVHAYLHPTENWCYRLIKSVPDCQITIVTDSLVQGEPFSLPGARFMVNRLRRLSPTGRSRAAKLIRFAVRIAESAWLRYVAYEARRADVLHAHFAPVAWRYLFVARRSRTPLVVSFYGYDYDRLPTMDPQWHERYEVLFREAAMFLTEGEAGRAKLIRKGCPPEKVRVAHLGVDVNAIPFRARTKRVGELNLVQVATFTPKKGYLATVRAFARASASADGITLTLVGGDSEGHRADVEEALVRAGLRDRVEILSGVPVSEIHQFLGRFHVLIQPSRHSESGDNEGGAPVVLLDAQATGMPVISTLHCDIPEEVLNEETGLLVPEDDVEQLAAAILRFRRMPSDEYARFCRRAREHVATDYNVDECGRRLGEIYTDMAAIERDRRAGLQAGGGRSASR